MKKKTYIYLSLMIVSTILYTIHLFKEKNYLLNEIRNDTILHSSNYQNRRIHGLNEYRYKYQENDKKGLIELFGDINIFEYPQIKFEDSLLLYTQIYQIDNSALCNFKITGHFKNSDKNIFYKLINQYLALPDYKLSNFNNNEKYISGPTNIDWIETNEIITFKIWKEFKFSALKVNMYNYVSDNDIVLASKILPKIFDLDYKIYVETIIKDIKHINYTIISIFTFQSIVFITICAKKFTKKLNKTNF